MDPNQGQINILDTETNNMMYICMLVEAYV